MEVVEDVYGAESWAEPETTRPQTTSQRKRPEKRKKNVARESSVVESKVQVFRLQRKKKLKVEEREKLEKNVLGEGSLLLRNMSVQVGS